MKPEPAALEYRLVRPGTPALPCDCCRRRRCALILLVGAASVGQACLCCVLELISPARRLH